MASSLPEEHTVLQGETVMSIAQERGFLWETLWKHPKNTQLKAKRADPDILMPGDVLHIPERQEKMEDAGAGQAHKFRRKGVPAKFCIVLIDRDGKPRNGEPYILDVEGRIFSGTTGGDGKIEERIPPNARNAKLRIGPQGEEVYNVFLGHTDPVTEISGVQSRLKNLGYDCGPINGILGPETESGLKAFQKAHNLAVTGKPDDPTRDKLEKSHGS